MERHVMLAMMWVGLAGQAAAQPTVKAEIATTEPVVEVGTGVGARAETTLGRDETFWVRISYESDEPVRLWARPYFRGKEAPAASNPSRTYVGSGYALGWFSFREPAEVDEIRIEAGGGKPYRERTVASYTVKLRWTSAAAEPREPASWVAELRAADETAQRAAMDSMMNAPVTAGDITLMRGLGLVLLAATLGGIVAPIRAYRKWEGGWRIAAAVPLAILAFVIARIVVGTAIDTTSHNLWPFELGITAFAALALIAVLTVARRVIGMFRAT